MVWRFGLKNMAPRHAGYALSAVLIGGCQIPDPAQADIDRLIPLLCEQAQSCFCASDLAATDCETARTTTWNDRIEAGRKLGLAYDPACVEAITERADGYGCKVADGDGNTPSHLCENYCSVFFGAKALGEECEAYDAVVSDCEQGLTCSGGSCVPPCESLTGLTEGQECRTELGQQIDGCALGLFCDATSRECKIAPKVGEPCPENICSGDAVCNRDIQRCVERIGEGQSCLVAECSFGLYCEYDFDEQTGSESAQCRRNAAEGESCSERRCDPGLACNASSVCQGPADEGEPCDNVGCSGGLLCSFELGKCIEPPDGEGQPCPEGTCTGTLWCDQTNDPMGECLPRGEIGDPCAGHTQCLSAYCPAGFCLLRPAEGEDCEGAQLCQGGLGCREGTCVPTVTENSAVCTYAGW